MKVKNHKITTCTRSDHRFGEDTHAVECVTVEQLARLFCGRSDATLGQDAAYSGRDTVDPATIDIVSAARPADFIVDRI